jgi:hypothetical protein
MVQVVEPASQACGFEYKPQYHQKRWSRRGKKKKKEHNHFLDHFPILFDVKIGDLPAQLSGTHL